MVHVKLVFGPGEHRAHPPYEPVEITVPQLSESDSEIKEPSHSASPLEVHFRNDSECPAGAQHPLTFPNGHFRIGNVIESRDANHSVEDGRSPRQEFADGANERKGTRRSEF